MCKYFKIFYLFSAFIFNVYADIDPVDACHEQFQPLTVSEIQNIFSDESNYKKYKAQTGYLLFAQKTPNIDRMEDLFELVFKALDRDFWKLKWRQRYGSPEQMQKERARILDENGKPKTEYLGMDGYIAYAEDYHEGDMDKAFQEILVSLDRVVIKRRLKWRRYNGFYEQMQTEGEQILDEEGSLIAEYLGMAGYVKYAEDYHKGDMERAYGNISAILDKTSMEELGWKKYHGFPEGFQTERSRILDEKGEFKAEYIGMDGYIKYTEDYYREEIKIGNEVYYKGYIFKAYDNVLAVFGHTVIQEKLKWKKYYDSVEQIKTERDQILSENRELRDEYCSIYGCASYAKKYHGGDMRQAYESVLMALGRIEFKELNWYRYRGFAEQFQTELERILNENGSFKREYFRMDGYSKYATDYYGGDMYKAYEGVLAVLGRAGIDRLGWRQYTRSSEEFQTERSQILDNNGNPKIEYLDMEGYIRYADDYHEGSMGRVYEHLLVILGRTIVDKELGWRQYMGSSEEFQTESRWILDVTGEKPKAEYIGMSGYSEYAIAYHNGNMDKSYKNVLAILDQDFVDKVLGWRRYKGFSERFHNERDQILDVTGYPKDRYLGMNGYIRYATDYHKGDMIRAFKYIWAIFGDAGMEFLDLNWIKFYGTSLECQNLLQLFGENAITEFKGVEGQRKVSQIVFEGDSRYTHEDRFRNIYKKVYDLAEILLGSKEAFEELGWVPPRSVYGKSNFTNF